jgi:hypothetical protein
MAGLLDTNAIQSLFGSVLSSIYGDGTLIRVVLVSDGQGGWTESPTEQPIKVQVDACTEAMRQQAGYTDNDVRLLILQFGVTGGDITSDDVVVARGKRWRCYGITQDPAASYWEARAVAQGEA